MTIWFDQRVEKIEKMQAMPAESKADARAESGLPFHNTTLEGHRADHGQRRQRLAAIDQHLDEHSAGYADIGLLLEAAGISEGHGDWDRANAYAERALAAALRIRTDEQLPVYERLGDIRSKAVTQGKIAMTLLARMEKTGDRADAGEANKLLCQALVLARRLRIPEARPIERILQRADMTCGDDRGVG